MKKKLLFLLLLVSGWMFSACSGGQKAAQNCQVKASVGFTEYTVACLLDKDGEVLDSLTLKDGFLTFTRTDTAQMPYVAFISLKNPSDAMDGAEMPIVVERGNVNVEIGEYITTSGTSLNVRLQQFLNGLQATSDALHQAKSHAEEIRRTFSEFYRQQILGNQDNVLGDFIYQHYGLHLNEADAALVKAQLGN